MLLTTSCPGRQLMSGCPAAAVMSGHGQVYLDGSAEGSSALFFPVSEPCKVATGWRLTNMPSRVG